MVPQDSIQKESLTQLVVVSLLVVLTISSLASTTRADDRAIGSGAVLRSGFGARALGMGGAFVAIADDYSATYWNPAGVTRSSSIFLGGMRYDKYGLGLNLDYLSGGLSFTSTSRSGNTLVPSISIPFIEGISFSGTYLGFSTDVRTLGPGGSEIPTTYAERTLLGTAGLKFPLVGAFGGSVKTYMYSAPDAGVDGANASAGGIGFDLGFISEPLPNFNVGAAAFDVLGTAIQWKNTPSEPTDIVPARYSLGTAYTFDFSEFSITEVVPGELTVAGQYSFGPSVEGKARAGLEYVFSLFSLRAGLIKPAESGVQFSAGAGLKIQFLTGDLAWVQNSSIEGENTTDTIVFSAEFEF
ncbi:hypothetical protein KGY64_08020 [Candidatus Bipolaricaulota bacterium]|nr:hypothetical protein [Candidatus Bipolaricaulota bacterium]